MTPPDFLRLFEAAVARSYEASQVNDVQSDAGHRPKVVEHDRARCDGSEIEGNSARKLCGDRIDDAFSHGGVGIDGARRKILQAAAKHVETLELEVQRHP